MKKKLVTMLLIGMMAFSFTACGSSSSDQSTDTDSKTEETVDTTDSEENDSAAEEDNSKDSAEAVTLDMDKCISDLKENLPLDPDYTFVQDYSISMKDDQITITAVVDDSTDPTVALDFADTLVRQLNLYAQMQDSSIESASKDFYGGLYERYDALVGVAPASQTDNPDKWFVYDGIVGGKVMLKLNKAYR